MVIAQLALLAWIPLAVLLGGFLRAPQAAAAILLGAVMFLPTRVGWDFPGLPAIGRAEIASLCLLGVIVLFHSRRIARARLGRGVDWLILLSMASILGTTMTNLDTVRQGIVVLPPLSYYNATSEVFPDLLYVAVPFLGCRMMARTAPEFRAFQRVFLGAMLFYSLLVLVELRLSPQLHRWVYGFHPHSFSQHIRYGGFRPMVFLGSGLIVSFFLAVATVLSAGFARSRQRIFGAPAIALTGWFWIVLVLSKSLAALLYGTLGAAIVFVLKPRMQMRAALMITLVALSYAPLRISGVLSTESIVSVAEIVSEERASSLAFRFKNEDLLMERASERPIFGWGGFRRNMVFDKWGALDVILDGYWIIVYGRRGLVGMVLGLAILAAPIVTAYRRFGRIRSRADQQLVSASTLMLSFALVDLQPNAMFTYLPYMLGGALLGTLDAVTSASGTRRRRKRSATPAFQPEPESAPEGALAAASGAPVATTPSQHAPSSLAGMRRGSRRR